MIETEDHGRDRDEAHVLDATSSSQKLAVVARGGLDAERGADPRRHPAARRRRRAASRRDRHGALAAHARSRRRSRARASVVVPGPPARRPRAAAAGRRGDDRAPRRGERRPHRRAGTASYRAAHLQRRGLPAAARDRRGRGLHRRRARRCSRPCRAVARSASRDESRPVLTGILVRFEAGQARDGGDRLVPALRRRRPSSTGECPSSRRSSRPARSRSLPRIAQAGDEHRARRAREPGRLRHAATSG